MRAATSFRPTTSASMLANDPALPQRDLLLDESEVSRRFCNLFGTSGPIAVDHCERRRTKYRIGESVRVLYRIRIDGAWHLVSARMPAHSAPTVWEAPFVRPGLRPLAYDAELKTVFRLYPHDRKIETLNALEHIPHSLSQIGAATWVRTELVAYTPEKCATGKCLDRDGNVIAYAKVYGGHDGCQVFEKYRALEVTCNSPTEHAVAGAFQYAKAFRLLLLRPVEGKRVADLDKDYLPGGFHSLGRSLAIFHQRPVPQMLPRFTRLDPNRIQRAAELIAQARPDVSEVARRLSNQLCSEFQQTDELVCLHGDVHPKNGIAHNGGVTLIDLDQVGVGLPAADLGSLIAALRYNRCVGLINEAEEYILGKTLLNAYCEVKPLPPHQSLRWHVAAALLAERAMRSIHRIRPDGLLHLRTLLFEAHEILRARRLWI